MARWDTVQCITAEDRHSFDELVLDTFVIGNRRHETTMDKVPRRLYIDSSPFLGVCDRLVR